MKCASHYSIADRIFKELIIPVYPKYKEELRNGSVHPDKEGVSIPHYTGRENDIELFIRKARKFMIDKKPKDALFYMGIAQHYIQDKCTSIDDSHKKHEKYEILISRCKVLPYGTDLTIYCPIISEGVFEEYENLLLNIEQAKEAEKLLQIIRKWKPPESSAFLDLNIAYRLSFKVSEMVLQPIKNTTFENLAKSLFSEYQEKISERDNSEKEKLNTKREEFVRLQEENGIFLFIPRFLAKLRLDKATSSYNEQKHLKDLFKKYNEEFLEISLPYRDWFFVGEPPEFSIGEVPVENDDIVVEQVPA